MLKFYIFLSTDYRPSRNSREMCPPKLASTHTHGKDFNLKLVNLIDMWLQGYIHENPLCLMQEKLICRKQDAKNVPKLNHYSCGYPPT